MAGPCARRMREGDLMRWPWSKPEPERRSSGGDYSDIIIRLAEAQAAGTAADVGRTAAVEVVSGALARAFAAATVEGPPWAADAITPPFLALVARDLVRRGQSLHVIRIGDDGRVRLAPAADWSFEGGSGRSGDVDLQGDDLRPVVEHHAHLAGERYRLRRLVDHGWHSLRRRRSALVGVHHGKAQCAVRTLDCR